jgi:L-threonylcarbamoyladenylate synthase
MTLLSTNDTDLRIAADALRGGQLVAFPTETVYGLGGAALDTGALAKIFAAKHRPTFDPLIVHIADRAWLGGLINERQLSPLQAQHLGALTRRFWPGPLTLVLPKDASVPDLATAGLPSVAIRMPAHPVALRLLQYAAIPVAAPSANSFGQLSPTTAAHVREDLGGRIDFIIEGGASTIGVESTVLDLTGEAARLLRPGGLPREEIEALIGPVLAGREGAMGEAGGEAQAQSSPGQLKSHYAPHTPLVVHEEAEMAGLQPGPGEACLYYRDLSPSGDSVEAASRLFQALHHLDSGKYTLIHAELPGVAGLGAAIRDRLIRASAKQ